MNVFEDLIEELRDENLIEDTILDLRSSGAKQPAGGKEGSLDFAFEGDALETDSEQHDSESDSVISPEESGRVTSIESGRSTKCRAFKWSNTFCRVSSESI